ncbi:DUF4153 domain-containing protein [Poriferisphaera sp. WC338]|uniref:DUF4153 domain-containing protein n=1 Tax=Poriferisphaera sp. WC338 TaxID=3425129 RepID=UPI003D818084
MRTRSVATCAITITAGIACFSMILEPSPLAITLTFFSLLLLSITTQTYLPAKVSAILLMFTQYVALYFTRLSHDLWKLYRSRHRCPNSRGRVLRQVALWVLPLIMGFIFILIFRAANPILSKYLTLVTDYLSEQLAHITELIAPLRIGLWVSTGLLAYTFLRARYKPHRSHPFILESRSPTLRLSQKLLSPPIILRSLILFNLIFLMQTAMDVRYLWMGAALPDGMTYASYAHRGAYPLVGSALLAGLFVILAFRPSIQQLSPRSRQALNGLVYLWIIQNIFLIANAIFRLSLYIGVFSLSRWRVAAAIWMLLVALGLITLMIKIATSRHNTWLVRINAINLYLVLLIASLFNFDTIIANYNVRHCQEITGSGVAIDVNYLASLGTDALPAMNWLYDHLPQDHPSQATLAKHIRDLDIQITNQTSDWQGWSLRRAALIKQHRQTLPTFNSQQYQTIPVLQPEISHE